MITQKTEEFIPTAAEALDHAWSPLRGLHIACQECLKITHPLKSRKLSHIARPRLSIFLSVSPSHLATHTAFLSQKKHQQMHLHKYTQTLLFFKLAYMFRSQADHLQDVHLIFKSTSQRVVVHTRICVDTSQFLCTLLRSRLVKKFKCLKFLKICKNNVTINLYNLFVYMCCILYSVDIMRKWWL